jgi:cell division protein ZapA
MAQVTVTIHKRSYQVGCEDGQEQHVAKLAGYLDRRISELAEKSGVAGAASQVAEARLLVMAALLVADELGDTYDELEALREAPPQLVADPSSIKAAEEARSIASAAKAQLAEAQTAARAAAARATQAEAALQAAGARAAELEAKLQALDGERAELRATVAALNVQKGGAGAAEDALASGLDSLAARIEGMAERLERAAAG